MTLTNKLQAATGGSRELDAEIAIHVKSEKTFSGVRVAKWFWSNFNEWDFDSGGQVYCKQTDGQRGPNLIAPVFTTSIDAALTLAPDGYKMAMEPFGYETGEWIVTPCSLLKGETVMHVDSDGEHQSLPLALCIAALKARGIE